MKRIYIDPGHGGSDSGATGNGIAEKEIVLEIGLQMSVYLRENFDTNEFYRRMSRTTDTFVSLQDRSDDANAWGADVFVSIHANAFNGKTRGFETFIHTSKPAGAQNLQNRMHTHILQRMHSFDSTIPDRGKKTANFHVLRATNMTAILSENLFVDHPQDAHLLQNPSFISAIAEQHGTSVAAYLNLKRKDTDNNIVRRVVVDGTQVGAYSEQTNVLNAVDRHLEGSSVIRIERA